MRNVGLYAIPSERTAIIYLLVLAAQFVIARQAASNYGVRLVTTVLARRAAKEKRLIGDRHERARVKTSEHDHGPPAEG
jgi:hypothetical protein